MEYGKPVLGTDGVGRLAPRTAGARSFRQAAALASIVSLQLTARGDDSVSTATNRLAEPTLEKPAEAHQAWNWHAQGTTIVQYHPGFRADYSGAHSLKSSSETKETVTLDLFGGARLRLGAGIHVDGGRGVRVCFHHGCGPAEFR